MSLWHAVKRSHPSAARLADAHYPRRRKSRGRLNVGPPAKTIVLLTEREDALWVASFPRPDMVWHAWPNSWVCNTFRNESSVLSSTLIEDAVLAMIGAWGAVPEGGIVTFIDPRAVRPKASPGYCFLRAGWVQVGQTARGKLVLGWRHNGR